MVSTHVISRRRRPLSCLLPEVQCRPPLVIFLPFKRIRDTVSGNLCLSRFFSYRKQTTNYKSVPGLLPARQPRDYQVTPQLAICGHWKRDKCERINVWKHCDGYTGVSCRAPSTQKHPTAGVWKCYMYMVCRTRFRLIWSLPGTL